MIGGIILKQLKIKKKLNVLIIIPAPTETDPQFTDLSKDILTSYSFKNTIKIFLTATYNKPLKEWNILPECQMYWGTEDEQICKSILIDNNLDRLKEEHGHNYFVLKLFLD